MTEVNWGPTGQLVYERTYSRTKPDGTRETWPETVERVVDGNLGLGDPRHELPGERDDLIRMMTEFKLLPAGRHLWASGVPGRQYLFNCHVSGWNERITDHFEFTFMRLMEGGGVGANYSNKYLEQYPEIDGYRFEDEHGPWGPYPYEVHIVCDPEHADYQKMRDAGLLSAEYDHEWAGSFEVDDSREGWAAALVDLISTYYRPAKNQKRVFDVSRVRPEGARLKTFGGRASGPLPLAVMLHEVAAVMNARIGRRLDGIGAMEIDHAIAKCVVSGGNRRSARMAIMHWADPQILDFIDCKAMTKENEEYTRRKEEFERVLSNLETSGYVPTKEDLEVWNAGPPEPPVMQHWTTNISVEVDDEFFDRKIVVGGHSADDVLSAIAEGMLTNGEPGFWNSTYSNLGEPNPVISTNPCGEIALEAWENCNLGHVNLAAFVDPDNSEVDEAELGYAHELMTRFLIRATYGDVTDPKQAAKLARNRRIGVGHLGVASFLALIGVRYSETPRNDYFLDLLFDMSLRVDRSAEAYSHDLRIPMPVKTRTVAPTGTVAKMPGVSEGIHPIFSKYFIRRIRFSDVDEDQMRTVEQYRDQGYGVEADMYAPQTTVVSLPTKDSLLAQVERLYPEAAEEIVESAADLSLQQMLAFQEMYQRFWADNAVSYTVNIDPADYTVDEVAKAIRDFGPNLKGATVFPEMSMPQSPYERITKEDYELYEDWQRDVADGVDEACLTGCPIK